MELTFRTATPAERLYSASQSMQLKGQTGCVGHLRAGTGMDAQGFLKTWQSHRQDLDTEEFQAEFESVLNALVGDGQYGGFLKSRDTMRDFCQEHPESGFNEGFDFGFRADTAQYSYLIRLNPYSDEKNLSICCYRRNSLDRHMKQAEKGIRFITPHYEEKFRIADGDMVRIKCWDGRELDHVCRYIDDCHVEIGKGWDNLFHICQFAEMMERNGNTVIPLRNSLPLICYGKVPEKRAIVMFERGFDGYRSASYVTKGRTSQKLVDELNSGMGVSKAQAAAMLAGATQGWATPAADPKNYDEQGQPILIIADLGLWTGRHMGYKEIASGNIRDCLYSDRGIDYATWFVDKLGDLRCDAIHHDGTNRLLYRTYKPGVRESQIDLLKEKLYYGTATRADITRITRRLGDEIGKVYGWDFPQRGRQAVSVER